MHFLQRIGFPNAFRNEWGKYHNCMRLRNGKEKTSSVAGHKSMAVTSKYGTLANGLKQLPTSKTFIFSGTFFIYRHCEQSNPIQDSNKRCSRDLFSKEEFVNLQNFKQNLEVAICSN
uniref:Uncharacterized protein n=1 Tax=Glossina austeni TaxID=7395 RepID=A0A1A9V1Z0_GLOAU